MTKQKNAEHYETRAEDYLSDNNFEAAVHSYQAAVKLTKIDWRKRRLYLKIRAIYLRLNEGEQADFYLKKATIGSYLINHPSKIIYCSIPKNACTLFKTMMVENSPAQGNYKNFEGNIHAFVARNDFALKMEDFSYFKKIDYFKFVILRNPFERLVSAYLDKVVKPAPLKNDKYVFRLIESIYQNWGKEKDLNQSISFFQFVEYLGNTEDFELNEHWRPQHTFLGVELSQFDYVGQFENLNPVLNIFAEKSNHNVKTNLPNINKTLYVKNNEQINFASLYPSQLRALPAFPKPHQFYTPEIRRMVATKYAKDIELYENAFGVKLNEWT